MVEKESCRQQESLASVTRMSWLWSLAVTEVSRYGKGNLQKDMKEIRLQGKQPLPHLWFCFRNTCVLFSKETYSHAQKFTNLLARWKMLINSLQGVLVKWHSLLEASEQLSPAPFCLPKSAVRLQNTTKCGHLIKKTEKPGNAEARVEECRVFYFSVKFCSLL